MHESPSHLSQPHHTWCMQADEGGGCGCGCVTGPAAPAASEHPGSARHVMSADAAQGQGMLSPAVPGHALPAAQVGPCGVIFLLGGSLGRPRSMWYTGLGRYVPVVAALVGCCGHELGAACICV